MDGFRGRRRWRAGVAGAIVAAAIAIGPASLSAQQWPGSSAASEEPSGQPGFFQQFQATVRGRMQLDAGYSFVYDSGPTTKLTEHALGDFLLRYGLTERLEVRIGWPGYLARHYETGGASSSDNRTLPPNVGFLFDLWPQQGIRPEMGVLAAVPITLQGNPFALTSMQPVSELLYRWRLSEGLSVGGSTGFALFEVGGDHFTQLQQTIAGDFLLTDRLATFVDWAMLLDHGSADDGSQHMLGGGVSYLLSQCLVVTWRAALGVNARAPDFLTDLQFGYRF